jgi:hypothetical protein
MKKTLQEELQRIHEITYGKDVINEQFVDNLLNKIGIGGEKKVDDPKKADLVTPDVMDFFNTIQSSISGGLSQQQLGSMTYQKAVESMQIGLVLLGYELPRFGVDGLFGPETAAAVTKFKQDNSITDDTQSQLAIATPAMLTKLLESLKTRGVKPEELKAQIDTITTGGSAEFSDLDLTTNEGFTAYSTICQKFIDTHGPNPLGITGQMLATGALRAFGRYRKYVPPELALAQLTQEGGIQNRNVNSRPIKTRNPFNVGNTDSGQNVQHNDIQSGINAYFDLIASQYLGRGRTAKDLVNNFVNRSGSRYATDTAYEQRLNSYAAQANRIATPIIAQLNSRGRDLSMVAQ